MRPIEPRWGAIGEISFELGAKMGETFSGE